MSRNATALRADARRGEAADPQAPPTRGLRAPRIRATALLGRRAAFVAALALAAVACSEEPARPVAPAAEGPAWRAIASLVTFDAPTGFTREERAGEGGVDPVVRFSSGLDRITVRVFGAAGSAHATPDAYLASPAASTMGRAPTPAGTVTVGDRTLPLYRRGFPIMLGDPHVPAAPVTLGREVFCVLPTSGARFVVLAWEVESPVPAPDGGGEDAWSTFLRSVRLVDATR